MQLEQSSPVRHRPGVARCRARSTRARARLLVVVTAALAASINVPYGGLPMAAAAFVLLASGGVALHLLGERKLRRITDELVGEVGRGRRAGR